MDRIQRNSGRQGWQGVGVDGCRAGWLYAAIDGEGDCHFGLAPSFDRLMDALGAPRLVLVDIPIGLPPPGQTGRHCDALARRAIAPRGSTVFSPPGRAALEAPDHAAACAVNEREHGRKISLQSWNIAPKIRQVDRFLRRGASRPPIREMHPEVAFWALNGCSVLAEPKKSAAGLERRLAVLSRHFPAARDAYERCLASTLRRDVARDDIVDALVGAVTACRAPDLSRFPVEPPRDEFGLAMEIVFANPATVGRG